MIGEFVNSIECVRALVNAGQFAKALKALDGASIGSGDKRLIEAIKADLLRESVTLRGVVPSQSCS